MSKKNDPTRIRTDRDADSYLIRGGCEVLRQSGSHKIYEHPDSGTMFVVPQHGELKKGLRLALIRAIQAAGLMLILAIGLFLIL